MNQILSKIIDTVLGPMKISAGKKGLTRVELLREGLEPKNAKPVDEIQDAEIKAILNQAETQLREYFEGRRKVFDLPLAAQGTDFQLRVWAELEKIPYGETRTYGEIAAALGKPKASRAVGGANNKNPISIILPCHRVIGKKGSLVGYASGLDNKKFLLKLEKENSV